MILLSIIIPCYNSAKTIRRCLDSLIMQKVEKEIIAINDGSDDDTFLILKEYAQKYKFFKLINKKHEGQSTARNYGIKCATGQYIFFCDSDDYIEDNSLAFLLETALKYNVDILKTGWKANNKEIMPPKFILNKLMTTRTYFFRIIKKWYNVVPWNGLFKTSFLLNNSLFFPNGIQFEDNTFALKTYLISKEASILQINSTFYHAVISNSSTTTSIPTPRKIYDQYKNCLLMLEFLDTFNDKRIIAKGKIAVSSLVFTMTSYFYRLNENDRKNAHAYLPKFLLKLAIKNSQNLIQKFKLFLFLYLKPILNIYEKAKQYNNV